MRDASNQTIIYISQRGNRSENTKGSRTTDANSALMYEQKIDSLSKYVTDRDKSEPEAL